MSSGGSGPRGAHRAQAQNIIATNAREFERREGRVINDELAKLKQEHEREIEKLLIEKESLREELTRVATILQEEILPREQQMHRVIEKMQEFCEAETRTFHVQFAEKARQAGMQDRAQHRKKLEALAGPVRDMEYELERISSMLGHDEVPEAAKPPRARVQADTLFKGTSFSRWADRPFGERSPWTSPKDATFNMIDRNGDGVISRTEWSRAMARPSGAASSGRYEAASPSYAAGRAGGRQA